MNGGHPAFDRVCYSLSELWIADAPENPATVFLDNGRGLADDISLEPDLIACACDIVPAPGQYCFVRGRNAEGEYLYLRRLQYINTDADGRQWFQWQK